jgi:hypothetical protein
MIIARLAIRKWIIGIKKKFNIDLAFKFSEAFLSGMSESRKNFYRNFYFKEHAQKATQESPYTKNLFRYGRKERNAIYDRLRSIYKHE